MFHWANNDHQGRQNTKTKPYLMRGEAKQLSLPSAVYISSLKASFDEASEACGVAFGRPG